MKLLTFVVPCYNSAKYMRKCIDSLLKAGDGAEILIINDGSDKDDTKEIADLYQQKYPEIIKAIHKENGGHGDAINVGLKNAQGKYFKVVDSDDWVEEKSLEKIMQLLRSFEDKEQVPDAIISNYVYEHVLDGKQRMVRFKNLPKNRLFDFEETKPFKTGKFLSMHSFIFRTDLLRSIGIELPKHTFYVDNILVYVPLPYIKKFYYLDVDFYRYFIGREDQSVAEKVQMERIDQQIKVGDIIINAHDINTLKKERPKLYKYMLDYILIMLVIDSIFLIKRGKKEDIIKKQACWDRLRAKDDLTYKKCRRRFTGITAVNSGITHLFCKIVYFFSIKIFKVN